MTTTDSRPTRPCSTPKVAASAGSPSPAPASALPVPMEQAPGRDQTAPQPTAQPASIQDAAAGPQAGRDPGTGEAHTATVPAVDLPGDHVEHEGQGALVAGEQEQDQRAAKREPRTTEPTPLADPFLALAADVVDDLEKVRIANENRLRQLTRTATDADGEERGFGLTEDHPDVARLAALVDMLAQAEHKAVLNLQRLLRKHPLGPWIRGQVGLGEKQAARLLAAIGDPYWNTLYDRPRTVSELWAYCGYHVLPAGHTSLDTQERYASGTDFPADQYGRGTQRSDVGGEPGGHPGHTASESLRRSAGVAAKRQRGARANWSATAKMRAYLIAESCVKQRSSPYRKVYDDTRDKYADAGHAVPCARCGPSGKPAPAGSPLSDGHKHARALRAVAKAVLKDLWREAKRTHEEAS